LAGRFAAENIGKYVKKGQLITLAIAKEIEADEIFDGVKIMSVLSANSVRGVPQKSNGLDPATGDLVFSHHPIGVIAAQSIGEPGTQLSLDSKHRSGAAVADDTAEGLSRVEELFEVRAPKGQAYLAGIDGIVNTSEENDQYIVQITAKKQKAIEFPLRGRTPSVANHAIVSLGDILAAQDEEASPLIAPIDGKVEVTKKSIIITPDDQSVVRYQIPGYKTLVIEDGASVIAGQRLTTGSINLHDLMNFQGVEATQRYIMNEILKIFANQGQNIADKHLEIIVRQMFSRVQIEDVGDSEFVTGDIVSKLAAVEANELLVSKKKQPIQFTQLLLGITKSSLSTDSFLSAASFQDTTRVLIAAATSGKVDKLFGLKENVILGRKIPVGTGFNANRSNDDYDSDESSLIDEVN
jgi:DNA-directed RNA polymerase subunit beta'